MRVRWLIPEIYSRPGVRLFHPTLPVGLATLPPDRSQIVVWKPSYPIVDPAMRMTKPDVWSF
jgi:hypothetical protein